MNFFHWYQKIITLGAYSMLLVLVAACNYPTGSSQSTDSPGATLTPTSPPQPATLQATAISTSAPSLTITPRMNSSFLPLVLIFRQTATPTSPGDENESPEPPTALVTQNALCRQGPGTSYTPVTTYQAGTQLRINGRNGSSSWWRVQMDGSSASCYISATLLQLSGDLDSVSSVPDLPTPMMTPTLLQVDTPTPTRPPVLIPTYTSTPSPTLLPPDTVTPTPSPTVHQPTRTPTPTSSPSPTLFVPDTPTDTPHATVNPVDGTPVNRGG